MNPNIKFSFIRRQSEKVYQAAYKRVLGWAKSFEIIRMVLLVVRFGINTFVYLYFVNLASTKGYFYGKEQNRKENIEFQFNITKLRVVESQSKLRNDLQESTRAKTYDIDQPLVELE